MPRYCCSKSHANSVVLNNADFLECIFNLFGFWAKTNLQREAENVDIDKNRLIFAPRVPIDAHLARHVHADLFLDTLPYNAHTTASDALFMDIPLLTCSGNTFASRVAASLLTRAGLPQFIAKSLADYEQKALHFAQNPNKLKIQSRKSALFNTTEFVFDLEEQYLGTWAKLSVSAKLPQKLGL